MKLWIDGIEQPDAPDVLYTVDFVKRLAKQVPGCVIRAVWNHVPGKSYGQGFYVYDPTHELVGSRWRTKDKRYGGVERKVVYIENFNGKRRAALREEGRNHTSIVRLLDSGVDRHERVLP
jgi:hypothetical protein